MRKFLLSGIMVLTPIAVLAQGNAWQSMDGPYFIYNVTGISVGYTDYGEPEQQTHAYAVGSDFDNEYIYNYHGDSPIGQWQGHSDPIGGIKYVSASRLDGLRGYAAVPAESQGEPGVHHTLNGQTWQRTVSQPGNLRFMGIETHPRNGDICFTGGSHLDNVRSVWRTINQGVNWTAAAVPLNDPYRGANSVRVDLNSGDNTENTTIYACFDEEGIWKNTQGGNDGYWTPLSLPGYGTSYSGVDIAAIGNSLYAISKVPDGEEDYWYELWHSTNGGTSWEGDAPVYSFGNDPVFKVMFYRAQEQDVVWAVSENNIYTYIHEGNPGWHGWSSEYQPIKCVALDESGLVGTLYIGTDISIVRHFYLSDGQEIIKYYDTLVSGTNSADVVSLDCVEGFSLRAIGRQGGVVCNDYHINYLPDGREEWAIDDYLQRLSPQEPENFIGTSISSYMHYSLPNWVERYLASGCDGVQGYVLDNGLQVNWGASVPAEIQVVEGPHYNANCSNLGGGKLQQTAENAVWGIYSGNSGVDFNLGSSPPVIEELLMEPLSGVGGRYYLCGVRENTQQHLVGYRYGYLPQDINWFDGGLGPFNVLKASAISKSKEIPELELFATLYLGTDQGVFKAKFDGTVSPIWYQANFGIGAGIEISKVSNYYHILHHAEEPRPDGIVQYALGHDASSSPYIYISADSGRSWIEIGSYFRDHNIQVNDLATFTDRRPNAPSLLWLGAGTDNGVYRYPFNVKSGTVASGERPWGPGLVIVNGDVTVPVGITLTIAPGTEVRFIYNFDRVGGGTPQRSAIKVYGALNADGEPSSPIVFKSSHPSAPAAGHWQGIEVYNTGTVTMDYCVVEHAVRGVYGYSSTTQPANVQITHCRFLNHTSAGIDLDRPSSQ